DAFRPVGDLGLLLRLDKLLLGELLLRDVEDRAVEPTELPRLLVETSAAIEKPAEGSVRVDDPILELVRGAGPDRGGDLLLDACSVVGVDGRQERAARRTHEVLGRVARDVADRLAATADAPRLREGSPIAGPRDVVGERAALLLGADERILRAREQSDALVLLRDLAIEGVQVRHLLLERPLLLLDDLLLAVKLNEHIDFRASELEVLRNHQVIHRPFHVSPDEPLAARRGRGDEDDRNVARALRLLEEARRFESIHMRHIEIEEDRRELVLEDESKRILPRRRLQAFRLERL